MTNDHAPDDDVLSAPSPDVDLETAQALARRHFGISGELSRLSGERDRNFHVRAACGAEYVLKFAHPSEDARIADFQTQALLHVARVDPDLPVQRVMRTRNGLPQATLRVDDPMTPLDETAAPVAGSTRVLRLFSYLPGLPWPAAERSVVQQHNLARMLARLDIALRDFRHPAGDMHLPWDIQRADAVAPLLSAIADPDRRALAARSLARFVDHAKPMLPHLRAQPIHNDMNIHNVLVAPDAHDTIAGILDFGDMVHAPLIDDLAVAAAYQLTPSADPVAAIAGFVAAYHAVNPLRAAELDVLFDLMMARMVMVVAIGGWRAARYPENADYILRNNVISWQRLAACDAVPRATAQRVLRAACNLS